MIFSRIGQYNGPFSPLVYARQALSQLQRALSTWHYSRTGIYPPFEEDALPTYMIART